MLIVKHAFVHCDSSQQRTPLCLEARPAPSLLLERTIPGVSSKDRLRYVPSARAVPVSSGFPCTICLSLFDLYSSCIASFCLTSRLQCLLFPICMDSLILVSTKALRLFTILPLQCIRISLLHVAICLRIKRNVRKYQDLLIAGPLPYNWVRTQYA